MVIRGYIKGIAFIVLVMSIASFVVEALTVTSSNPPGTSGTVVDDIVGASRTFTLNVSEPANFTWYIDGNFVHSDENLTTSSYTNNSAVLGNWSITVDAVSVNDSTTQNHTWWWNVTAATPNGPDLVYTPLSNPTSPFGDMQNFTASSNQTVDFSWLINGTEVQYNPSTTSSTYSNSTAGIGIHNVTVNINNSNGVAFHSWNWNVIASPGPDTVSGLSATSGATWINWTWTNPGGNFNHTMVSINGTFQTNTSDDYFNYTQFTQGTPNTISLQTVDTFGVANSTVTSNKAYTLNTPTGTNVSVPLTSGLTVIFSQVDTEGNTSVNISSMNLWGPTGFSPVGNYYDITTTVPPSGSDITVELGYNPAGINESTAKLYHWSGTSWDDVTTSLDTTNHTVSGKVASLSPFVVGVPPKPIFTTKDPATPLETIGTVSQIFKVTIDQTTDVTWSITPGSPTDIGQVLAGVETNFTYTPPPGNYTVSVTATNTTTGSSNTTSWTWTVRSKTYATGDRVWDSSKDMSLTYTWNPMSFYAFYYDLDSNVGNESLQITLDSKDDRNIQRGSLIYSTTPNNVSFKHADWGGYDVIGFMAEQYFVGYTAATKEITDKPVSTLNYNQIHKILMDDDTQRAVYAGSTLTLSEGYVIKIKDVDVTGGRIVLLSLLKDGGEVDTMAVPQGGTYKFTKRVGVVNDLPIIAVHVENVFSGTEANAAFIKGIFQISESFTAVNTGNRYGIMEITDASAKGINMDNRDSFTLSPGATVDVMGDIKFIVADNDSVLRFAPMVKKLGTYEIRGTISQNETQSMWNPMNFEGFYYNLDEDIGSENLSLVRNDRVINKNNLIYTATIQPVSFKYTNFGQFNVIGFMAEKYFAGYIANPDPAGITKSDIPTIGYKQLHKVLVDDDAQRIIYAGSTLTLNDGYVVKIKDVNIGAGEASVWLTLLKDGNEIFDDFKNEGETFTYAPSKVGSINDLPIIALHIDKIFRGKEATAAFIKGIFQISEKPTTINIGDNYGVMEISDITATQIQMNNPSSLTLSPASTIDVMGDIKFKVADSDEIRFYPFIMANGTEVSATQLAIDVPASPMARDTITIAVTSGSGTPVEGAEVSFDGNVIGVTNSTGKLDYLLTKSGLHTITATKLGYDKATKTIQVSEYRDVTLKFELPSVLNQGIPVLIKVISNGTAIADANVTFDSANIGKTDANGILNYTFTVSGTHNLGASKQGYISVVREISIRMPFTEYKALDINITPGIIYANQQFQVWSNITNVGTKADMLPISLIINSSVVDSRNLTLAPGATEEINFTRKMNLPPGNYTVEVIGQKKIVEVKEEPLNYLLIGGIVTVLGAIAIYVFTAKSKLGLDIEAIKRKLNIDAFRNPRMRSGKKGL